MFNIKLKTGIFLFFIAMSKLFLNIPLWMILLIFKCNLYQVLTGDQVLTTDSKAKCFQ